MGLEFNSRRYVLTHGRAPGGRGSWTFSVRGLSDEDCERVRDASDGDFPSMWNAEYVQNVTMAGDADKAAFFFSRSMPFAEARAAFSKALRAVLPDASGEVSIEP